MSHTVVRGKPTASQLYLDRVLDEVLLDQGIKPDDTQRATVTISKLIFYCLKRNLYATFMVSVHTVSSYSANIFNFHGSCKAR